MPDCHVDQRSELSLHALERRSEQVAAGNDDDVDPVGPRGEPEYLPHPPLGKVAVDGAAQFLAGRYPNP